MNPHTRLRDPSPAVIVEEIDAAARRLETPCGEGRLVWRRWGDGPVLVLLHGGHGSWKHWLRNIPGLAKCFAVLAVDMPGYGDSAPAPGEQTAEGFGAVIAAGLNAILPANELRTIVGFSFGGVIGGQVARLQGEKVERIVVVGSGGLGLRRATLEPMVNWRRLHDAAAREAAHRRNLAILMIHDPARIDPLAVHLQAENTRRVGAKSRLISSSDTLRRCLEDIDAPIAGIWGEHDATAVPFLHEREALLRAIDPGAEFVTIPDAGHWVQYEAPDAFNAALLGVLARKRQRSERMV
jgi:2-hydroxy-6-oxonona-2,4-dienedioate hydrolase